MLEFAFNGLSTKAGPKHRAVHGVLAVEPVNLVIPAKGHDRVVGEELVATRC